MPTGGFQEVGGNRECGLWSGRSGKSNVPTVRVSSLLRVSAQWQKVKIYFAAIIVTISANGLA